MGSCDPNPLVDGGGNKKLRDNGIEVIEHVMERECDALNEIFFHYISKKTPFVAMKYAMTLDGKIAAFTGDSKWVTGEEARKHVHYLRKRYAGIMAGIGTVLADDPMLNCRIEDGVDPVRIICDSALRIPENSNIVKTACDIKTIVACSDRADESAEKNLTEKGVHVVRVPSLPNSILLEGGGTLNASALEQNIVNKIYAYIAPKLIGGADAKSPIEGRGIEYMKDAVNAEDVHVQMLGNDICIEGRIKEVDECLPE